MSGNKWVIASPPTRLCYNEFDGLALVALDTKQIAYIPFLKTIKKTVILRDKRQIYKQNTGAIAPYIDEFPLNKFLEHFTGKPFDEMAKDRASA